MGRRHDTVSFLSDYGLVDEFVGVVKSVVRGIAPHVTVVDITHQVPAHDVRAGSLTLVRAVQYLAPGVVLAVVDPGVGGERRAVAVEVAEAESVFVGPDNGLLASAVSMTGGATRAVSLTNTDYHLPSPGPTFAGRDIFGPAAANLSNGVDLAELGELVDPMTLLPGVLPVSTVEDGVLHAEVLWIDNFGNVQLNVGPEEIEHLGERIRLRIGDHIRLARRRTTYGDIGSGEVGVIVDSYGLVAISLNRMSAADELSLHPGAAVFLEAP